MNDQETYTSSAPAETKTKSDGKASGKSIVVRVAVAVISVLVIIGIAWMSGLLGGASKETPNPSSTGNQPASALTPEQAAMAVAVVNGVEISRGEFEKTLTNVKTTLTPESTAALEAGALEKSVIADMVNMRLLLEAAKKKNIQVSDEDVQKEYAMFEESIGGEPALLEELGKVGLDKESFRENIKNELTVRALLSKETTIDKITVTDAEIAKIYEEAKAVAPEDQPMPPLDEVKDAARAQLTQQKSAEIINAYIQTLRKDAKIEIKL